MTQWNVQIVYINPDHEDGGELRTFMLNDLHELWGLIANGPSLDIEEIVIVPLY